MILGQLRMGARQAKNAPRLAVESMTLTQCYNNSKTLQGPYGSFVVDLAVAENAS